MSKYAAYCMQMILISKSTQCLQYNLYQLNKPWGEYGMKLNVEKSKRMVVRRKSVKADYGVQGKRAGAGV